MQRMTRVAALAATLFSTAASAEWKEIQWKQTFNLPKGLNMPQGVSADILGIQLGDSYAEAKSKLEAIRGQSRGSLVEKRVRDALGPSNADVLVVFVRGLELAFNPSPGVSEVFDVRLSAPSSGHQVVGISRTISYSGAQNEIRLDALLESLRTKFKAAPKQFQDTYAYQFDNGKLASSKDRLACSPYTFTFPELNERSVPDINKKGDCDVSFHIQVRQGQSAQHLNRVVFQISDNERLKQNYLADFAFIKAYVQAMKQQLEKSGGAPGPKL